MLRIGSQINPVTLMSLTSNLFSKPRDQLLEDCAVRNSSHITLGASGAHVFKIQLALKLIDNLDIDAAEVLTQTYGESTAAAVLSFKRSRNIINRAYQNTEDNIVGIMTIAALDREMKTREASITPDLSVVNAANMRRLAALAKAEREMQRLKATFEPGVPDANDPVVQALQRQLFMPLDSNFWNATNQVLSMITKNRTTASSFIVNKAISDFAQVNASNPGSGVTAGSSFFTTNPNCQHEVLTHEFFHFIVGPQHFYTTNQHSEAMRCPHHLARVVFDIALGQQLAACPFDSGVLCH